MGEPAKAGLLLQMTVQHTAKQAGRDAQVWDLGELSVKPWSLLRALSVGPSGSRLETEVSWLQGEHDKMVTLTARFLS